MTIVIYLCQCEGSLYISGCIHHTFGYNAFSVEFLTFFICSYYQIFFIISLLKLNAGLSRSRVSCSDLKTKTVFLSNETNITPDDLGNILYIYSC